MRLDPPDHGTRTPSPEGPRARGNGLRPFDQAAFDDWISALEARHLADLRLQEVTRALRALSSAYIERRHVVAAGATLASNGKRAAFALFYAPLHVLVVDGVLRSLGVSGDAPTSVLDLGCGTGAAGAAWALAVQGQAPSVQGLDRHPWAAAEATWTYRTLGLRGRAAVGDVAKLHRIRSGTAVVAAYTINELPELAREALVGTLLDALGHDPTLQVLVVEPIARSVTPWWSSVTDRFVEVGGRADEWTLDIERPPLVAKLDSAAGLDHRRIKVRTLFVSRHRI
jgi:SAM-dependent methyltransferase